MNVALIGNPNCGKTSVFNKLTGSNQKVGNWPGVTIERKEGKILKTDISIVDLPGIYSLEPYTSEEIISRDYLLENKPDLVVNVVDSTALERSLFLTTQLFDLGINVVLALNMTDLLRVRGLSLDEKKLSKILNIPAIKISAKTGQGFDELIKIIERKNPQSPDKSPEIYSEIIKNELKNIKKECGFENRFLCIESLQNGIQNNVVLRAKNIIEKVFKTDIEEIIANEKYNFISMIRDECLKTSERKSSISDKLDKVFLNRWLAIPIFIVIMSFVYVLSVGIVGSVSSDLLEKLFSNIGLKTQEKLYGFGASDWAVSLVVNGVIAGIGSVLSFVPQLVVIFLCLSVLESTGYMSRISLIFDRVFRKFGLSGKSLVPFIVGTGCTVPAISLAKTIENADEHEMTVVLSPFIPCSAKLPIISLFVGFFFPGVSGLITASLYFLAIIVILLSAIILKKLFYKRQSTSFISELPEYKLPSVKYIFRDVLDKTKDFIIRVGTIIVFCSIIVWFLSSFGWNLRLCDNIQNSILAWIGNLFGWFFYPIIGEWNWAVSVSAIQGLVAKEQVVSSMSIIAGLENTAGVGSLFSSGIFSCFTRASAYAFVVFNLFSAPCVSAIGAIKNELKSTKKMWLAVLFQIIFAWIVSSLIYLIGSLFL